MSATAHPTNRGEMVLSAPDYCEECKCALAAGDRVAFSPSKTAGIYRYWHEECFDRSVTPLKDWPKLTGTKDIAS